MSAGTGIAGLAGCGGPAGTDASSRPTDTAPGTATVAPTEAEDEPMGEGGDSSTPSGGEPPDLPPDVGDNCIGFLTGHPDEVRNVALVGAAWTRPHPGPFSWGHVEREPGTYDFSGTDAVVRAAGENRVAVLPTVFPFATWDQDGRSECAVPESDIFRADIPPHRCAPNDVDAYTSFLEALVERYNGIGDRAMPGLELPVRYWEIANEPSMRSPELTFFYGAPEEYVDVLRASYAAVKRACPDCQVLHGGAANAEGATLEFWDDVFAAGGGAYFDVANVHFIGRGDDDTLNVAPFKRLLEAHDIEKPIWVTEVQFEGEDAPVLDMTRGAFEAGAEKVFYVSFRVGGIEPPRPGEFDPRYAQAVDLCDR